MARVIRMVTPGYKFLALVLECLMVTCGAAAQCGSSPPRPVTLNRRTATALILSQVKPEYPPLAKVNYIQGRVRLQVSVSLEGKVTTANVIEGHPFLAAAALKAVRHWLYQPFKTGAGAFPFVTLVDVNFALRNTKINQLPPQPEEDLSRQIRPPEMLSQPPAHFPTMHVRVLVSDQGEALDVNPVAGSSFQYDTALKFVEHCQFQPARWGRLAVPWYLNVDVPAQDEQASGDAH
jgi:TonB family protein